MRIADIAAQAGVTAATVSMCLSNNPRISQATRDRVQAIARELGYRPNPYISALMRTRRKPRQSTHSPIVALVGAFDKADGWRTTDATTIRQMREGAIERAIDRGYEPRDFWLYQDGMSPERFSQMLHTRAIQGLLLGPSADDRTPPPLAWQHFAVVSLSTPFRHSSLTTICNDHHLSAFQAVEEAHRLGYRRPGLVLVESQHRRLMGRWAAGFATAQQFLPEIEPTPLLLVKDWRDPRPILEWVRRERPDVVVTSSGLSVQSILSDAGWRIPHDIGLVGLGISETGQHLSGTFQNGKLIGATAMDVLITKLERNEFGLPQQGTSVMVESKWNPGETLRPLSPTAESEVPPAPPSTHRPRLAASLRLAASS